MSDRSRARHGVATAIDETLARHGVRLTIGGEPTFLPEHPQGEEWNHAAVGPGKLAAAQAMARHLLDDALPGGACFFSPGKTYPGERDPRWSLWLVARRDGRPLFAPAPAGGPSAENLARFRAQVCRSLGVADTWREFADPVPGSREAWAILLDAGPTSDPRWKTSAWPAEARWLVDAAGPAGLRLPLHLLAAGVPRRAVSLEWRGDRLGLFLPPLLQPAFVALLEALADGARRAGLGAINLQGSVPPDDAELWIRVGLAADPGVLEVNLPAAGSWAEYDRWMRAAARAAAAAGLRPWRQGPDGRREETGGGNHLLWGGPRLDEHPFFTRPGWLASILRYWQRHPALSYCFSGNYLGPWSQAPRADESGRELHDLEWSWASLDRLPAGDRRREIADAVRHFQTDLAGNPHRTEISFDKFWCPTAPGGCQGLVEFRAIAMMPEIEWAGSVALLWSALAAWLLERPCPSPLVEHGRRLHDRFFLPSLAWRDLEEVLADLGAGGYPIPADDFRSIWNWRFPAVLDVEDGAGGRLTVRRAGEPWPTLADTPASGGVTSRFVDSSLRRLEFLATAEFASRWTIAVDGRPLPLAAVAELPDHAIAGLRYRHSRLSPSLHPAIEPQLPLRLTLRGPGRVAAYELTESGTGFAAASPAEPPTAGPPCRPIRPGDLTCDLRLDASGTVAANSRTAGE